MPRQGLRDWFLSSERLSKIQIEQHPLVSGKLSIRLALFLGDPHLRAESEYCEIPTMGARSDQPGLVTAVAAINNVIPAAFVLRDIAANSIPLRQQGE